MEAAQLTSKKRKPLADCTNTLAKSSRSSASSSTSVIKPTNPLLSSAFNKLLNDTKPKSKDKPDSDTRTRSTTPAAHCQTGSIEAANPTSTARSSALHSSLPSTPSRLRNSSSFSGTENRASIEPGSVYTRRRNAGKGKSKENAIVEPMTCPPMPKRSIFENRRDEERITNPSKLCKVPHKRCRQTSKQDLPVHAMSQDFIKQQRAYFAEVDAFELSEEEVTSADELE
ncbi:uncharacterized protein LOC110819320 isoform X2 [Carica papaya]|uniref:uncharacterized protein LOC110819320 isoform X2 n=1 Tax=Carica papaya TaxID=3649 RepID=UPI000B8CFBDD|nr:uncharacterized protein LOC110819320 isoform X2 [Carica papaya]